MFHDIEIGIFSTPDDLVTGGNFLVRAVGGNNTVLMGVAAEDLFLQFPTGHSDEDQLWVANVVVSPIVRYVDVRDSFGGSTLDDVATRNCELDLWLIKTGRAPRPGHYSWRDDHLVKDCDADFRAEIPVAAPVKRLPSGLPPQELMQLMVNGEEVLLEAHMVMRRMLVGGKHRTLVTAVLLGDVITPFKPGEEFPEDQVWSAWLGIMPRGRFQDVNHTLAGFTLDDVITSPPDLREWKRL